MKGGGNVARTAGFFGAAALVALCAVDGARAQVVAELVPKAAVVKAKPPAVQLVSPAGVKVAAKEPVAIEMRTVSSERDQTLQEVMSGTRVAVDKKSLAAIMTLNPAVRADGTVPAGTKVTYFAPAFAAGQVGADQRAVFDMGMAAKYKVSEQTAIARQAKLQAAKYSADVYEQPTDAEVHRALVTKIETTASLVERRADKLTAKDLALSRYYLSQANASAQGLTKYTAAKRLPSASIAQLQTSVTPLEGMQVMMLTSGSPFDYRPVVVKVSSKPGAPAAEPLRVYTLPSGILTRPETYTEDEISEYLAALSFEKLTSPSRSMVAQGEMRVWVGPNFEYAAMAKLVMRRAPIRFSPVHPVALGGPEQEIEFIYPTDVVRP